MVSREIGHALSIYVTGAGESRLFVTCACAGYILSYVRCRASRDGDNRAHLPGDLRPRLATKDGQGYGTLCVRGPPRHRRFQGRDHRGGGRRRGRRQTLTVKSGREPGSKGGFKPALTLLFRNVQGASERVLVVAPAAWGHVRRGLDVHCCPRIEVVYEVNEQSF